MSKLNNKLSEALNTEPIKNNPVVETKPTEIISTNEVEEDAHFARSNIRELITKGNQAMDQLLAVARESEHPRAYEVAATLIKSLADMNKDLLDLQKKRKDLTINGDGFAGNAKNLNVDKAVFVGSTTELINFLKNNK
jgi:hypothetical protein